MDSWAPFLDSLPARRQRIHHDGHVIPEAKPLWATRRRPERLTFGPIARFIAVALGEQLMPWQEDALDVILEYRITPFGVEFFYDVWLVTLPRQSGKTLMAFVWMMTRCLVTPGGYIWTAQNHTKAADKWVNEMFPKFEASDDLMELGRPYKSNGKESIKFFGGRSVMRVAGSAGDDAHGPTLRGAGCDEIWDVDREILDGIGPALSTPDQQLGLFSTAGEEQSDLLEDYQAAGIEAVRADTGEGMAFFHYGAREGDDVEDESLWYDMMPSLGHITTIRTIRSKLRTAIIDGDKGRARFRRAYGNLPEKTMQTNLVDPAVWESMQRAWSTTTIDASSSVQFGLHVSFELDVVSLTVVVDGERAGVVKTWHSTEGVAEAVNMLTERFGTKVRVAANGQAAMLRGLKRFETIDAAQLPVVCAEALDMLNDGALTINPHPGLTEAVERAVKQRSGERWQWKPTPVSAPLWSLTLALAPSILADRATDESTDRESVYETRDLVVL